MRRRKGGRNRGTERREGRYSDKLTNQPRVIFQDFLLPCSVQRPLYRCIPPLSLSPADLTTNNTLELAAPAADSKWHFHPPPQRACASGFVPALLPFPSFLPFLGLHDRSGAPLRSGRREGRDREGDIRSFQSRSADGRREEAKRRWGLGRQMRLPSFLPQRRAKRPLRNCHSSFADGGGAAKVGKNGSLVIT